MFNLKFITLKKLFCASCSLMFIFAAVWFFQTATLSSSSDKVIEAQKRLASLKQIELMQFGNQTNYGMEQMAENLAFEKIESVHYIKVTGSTALAR
ncbi:hypothetical protein KKC63_01125 [Patescibacteria group bacterium]|nr:hypothetical protein [Patescibacteria group bacterium]MBU4023037.1 hypothetical protein [Patescibacteria group bacterium]